MSAVRDLRVRIASVKTIAKITKTLSLVASSTLTKCRKLLSMSEEKMLALEGPLLEILGKLQNKRPKVEGSDLPSEHTTRMVIVIGSERGFCGTFNSKLAKALHAPMQAPGGPHKIVCLGKKMFPRLDNALKLNLPRGLEAITDLAFYLCQRVLDEARAGPISCTLAYNRFRSVLASDVEIANLTNPYFFLEFFIDAHKRLGEKVDDALFPQNVYQLYLQSVFHFALLSSRAAEESSRVVAMDNATKNSQELARSLTIKMNKIRQETITRELIEILTGAQGA